jgi:glycosyltransferase involved in cell wall biosynthesis
MFEDKKIIVIMPAFNAEKTLGMTYAEIPLDIVDEVILVDDASEDNTVLLARELGIQVLRHDRNLGYGGNQKTCYHEALKRGADIVVMLHPDYQYSPKLITAMVAMIASSHYDVILASRILGKGALIGGMPLYKYVANRVLTALENLLIGSKLSEFHTGYRAWTKEVLMGIPLHVCSNDFIFDNQMLAQVIYRNFRIGEISCPTKYFKESSSINFYRSVIYGLGVVSTAISFRLNRMGLIHTAIFKDLAPAQKQ